MSNFLDSLRRSFRRVLSFRRCNQETNLQFDLCDRVPDATNNQVNCSEGEKSSSLNICRHSGPNEFKNWSFYWPNTTHLDAEKVLSGEPDGSYLIRDTSSNYAFSMSIQWAGKVAHCHFKYDNGKFFRTIDVSADEDGLTLFDFLDKPLPWSQQTEISIIGTSV